MGGKYRSIGFIGNVETYNKYTGLDMTQAELRELVEQSQDSWSIEELEAGQIVEHDCVISDSRVSEADLLRASEKYKQEKYGPHYQQ